MSTSISEDMIKLEIIYELIKINHAKNGKIQNIL